MNHRGRARRADPAGAPARRDRHHDRAGAPRILRQRGRRSPTPRPRSSRGWSRAAPRSSPMTARTATGCSRRRSRHAGADRHLRPRRGRGRARLLCRARPARRLAGHRAAARRAAELHHRPARRALGGQRAGRAGRGRRRSAATSRWPASRSPSWAGSKGRGERHRIAVAGRRGAADRRKLQRQPGLDGGDA